MHAIHSRPPILISDADRSQLYKIARSAANTFENIADELMTELERAELCPASQVPPNVVRMQSIVRFVTDTGNRIGSGAYQLSDLD